MRIRGSTVIVTGASSGIGRITAVQLAKRGALVWAVARDEARLQALSHGQPGITPWRCDVSIDSDRQALVEATGAVDVLINNAGLGWSGLIETMPAADVRRLFDINVVGLVDLTQRVLPAMLRNGKGHVVNVASIAGYIASPPISVYAATKFAVHGFSDGLRREVQGRGVTVTLVSPGPVATEWWARSNGLTPEPGAPEMKGTGAGVPASFVARAIVRSIRMRNVPGYQTVAVPRLAGLVRLGALPVVGRLVDVTALGGRQAGEKIF